MDDDKKQRKNNRLKFFDYSTSGAYFVTICVQGMLHLFSNVENDKLVLSPAGEMVENVWSELSSHYSNIKLGEFIVMPNHVHGIVWILEGDSVGEGLRALLDNGGNISMLGFNEDGQAQGPVLTKRLELFDIVRDFKSLTTVQYIKGVKTHNWQAFNKNLWQRSYYDRIIRNETELNNIRQYIIDNPKNWLHDKYNIEKSIF